MACTQKEGNNGPEQIPTSAGASSAGRDLRTVSHGGLLALPSASAREASCFSPGGVQAFGRAQGLVQKFQAPRARLDRPP